MRIFTNKKQGKGHLKIVGITTTIFDDYADSLDVKIELVNSTNELDQKTLDEIVIPRIVNAVFQDLKNGK